MDDNVLRISYFLIILATGLCESDTSNEPCTKKNNGMCVPLEECPPAVSLLKLGNREAISNITCGFVKESPKVCCTVKSAESAIVFDKNAEETATNRPSRVTTTQQVEFIPLIPDKPLDPLPNRQVCGKFKVQNRIYGGKNTDIGEFPWLARLKYEDKLYGCGASLITDRYVITSAHCVQKNINGIPTSVRLSEWDEETEKDCVDNICNDKPVDVNITNYFVHPEFNIQDRTAHDIALLKLEESVNFTDFIQPVCLPTTEYIMMQDNLRDSSYWAVGWGITEYGQASPIKRKVKLEAVSAEICEGIFKTIPKTSFPYLICAGGREGKDTCRGDSGGPLVRQVMENYENNWYLFGITSLGTSKCGAEGLPGLYTRVSKYINWITDIITNN